MPRDGGSEMRAGINNESELARLSVKCHYGPLPWRSKAMQEKARMGSRIASNQIAPAQVARSRALLSFDARTPLFVGNLHGRGQNARGHFPFTTAANAAESSFSEYGFDSRSNLNASPEGSSA